REELQRIHELSRDPRMRQEFAVNVIGPTNRINDFVSSEAVAAMLGMSRQHPTAAANTLDLLDILNNGHILLVDLQPGRAVAEQAEAEELAHTAIPLDLEMPVEASKRPVQIGHVIGHLHGMSDGVHELESEGATVVESTTRSRAKTFMHSVTSAHIESHAIG